MRTGMGDAARRRLGRFARDEGGAVTVEAVLWLPIFLIFLMLVADVSMAFYGKAQAFRTIQDANRALAVRRVPDTTAVVAMVENAYQAFAPNAQAASRVDNGVVTTWLRIPVSDLVIFVTLGNILDSDIYVSSSHYLE